MSTELWGEFSEDEKPLEIEKVIPIGIKRAKLEEVQSQMPVEENKNITIKVKNPLVTQTIEVMKQTEMLQSLIDTYSNKSGSSNYLLNPCQMIPEVDFPPENAADFVSDEKFAKPLWFVPPKDTDFARGVPQSYPKINTEICRASLRKAVCGQLRMTGFTDAADSALVLFADAIEEFIRNFIQQVQEVYANSSKGDTEREIDVKHLEKAYFSLANASLTQVHNYFKHNIIARNRSEIAEFKGVLHEYDKLMKESQNMQKEEFHGGDFLNILEMPPSSDGMTAVGGVIHDIGIGNTGIINMMDGQTNVQHSGGFKDAFHVQNTEVETNSDQNAYKTEFSLQSSV